MPDFFASKADFDAELRKQMAPVLAEIESIKSNRANILAEKRKLERKSEGVTQDGIIRTADALHVPRDLARAPADYQKWRRMAQEDGIELKIIDAIPEKHQAKTPNAFTTDPTHFVSRDYVKRDHA